MPQMVLSGTETATTTKVGHGAWTNAGVVGAATTGSSPPAKVRQIGRITGPATSSAA